MERVWIIPQFQINSIPLQVTQMKKQVQENHYGKVRSKIKNGDILLYKGKGFVSNFIKLCTRSQYSHAGIAAVWNNRLMVLEAVSKGVVATPLSENISKYKGDVEWFASQKPISATKRTKMVQFAQLELGKSYAFLTLAITAIRVLFIKEIDKRDNLKRSGKLFCSYYVAQIYNSVNLDLKKNKSDRFMSPQDIADSSILKRMCPLKIEPGD